MRASHTPKQRDPAGLGGMNRGQISPAYRRFSVKHAVSRIGPGRSAKPVHRFDSGRRLSERALETGSILPGCCLFWREYVWGPVCAQKRVPHTRRRLLRRVGPMLVPHGALYDMRWLLPDGCGIDDGAPRSRLSTCIRGGDANACRGDLWPPAALVVWTLEVVGV